MAFRAREDDVRQLVESDSTIKMTPFLRAANQLVDYVVTQDTAGILSSDSLLNIEAWLAAHFYSIRDQPFQQKQTSLASGQFQGKTDMGLNSTFWGQQAMILDVTGTLAALNAGISDGIGRRLKVFWLGTEDQSGMELEAN